MKGEDADSKRLLTLKVHSEKRRNTNYILITKGIVSRLRLEEGLYRIRLIGIKNSELYIYINPDKKNKLVTNRLDPRKTYLASIEKVSLEELIDIINSRINRYGDSKLKLDSGKLYIIFPDDSSIQVSDYILEKPHGGKLRLLLILKDAENRLIQLKITLIDGRLYINIITGYSPCKGRDLRAVEKIWLEKNLVITYRKGERDHRNMRIPI